jgi:hypothetical protein
MPPNIQHEKGDRYYKQNKNDEAASPTKEGYHHSQMRRPIASLCSFFALRGRQFWMPSIHHILHRRKSVP